jgi:thioredoxin reductase
METDFDVIVIGGSFAGLSATLQLARARRSVLVLDHRQPRNRFTRHTHGLLGHDGKSPERFFINAKKDILQYPTVRIYQNKAISVQGENQNFKITTETGEQFSCRKLILATGIQDYLPPICGIEERWGRSIFHCPYCDAYEYSNRSIGCLASESEPLHLPLLLTEWSNAVTLFLNDVFEPNDEQLKILSEKNIQLEKGNILDIGGSSNTLQWISTSNKPFIPIDVLFISQKFSSNNFLAEQLGCEMKEGPFGAYLKIDTEQQTSIPGVYAAGDLCHATSNAALACADGVTAGIFSHQALLFETWN